MIDRAIQIIVVFMAALTASEAQEEKSSVAARSEDTSSIVLEPKTAGPTQPTASGRESSDRSGLSASVKETLPGKPFEGSTMASNYIESMIAAGLPKYDPAPKVTDKAATRTNLAGAPLGAVAGITSLPAFIVRDSKIPTEDQILSPKGRAKIVMNKYLGPSDGLDRGLLNSFTLKELWMKVPILRAFPIEFVGTPARMSNEDRAYDAGGANDTIPYPHPPPKAKDGSDE